MVRHLQPTPDGLPLEIYAFSTETGLETYEGVQADIFDHLLAVMPYFELRVFQHPTGENMKALKEWLRSETVT
jgi:miniconductance mechanosensitive channel